MNCWNQRLKARVSSTRFARPDNQFYGISASSNRDCTTPGQFEPCGFAVSERPVRFYPRLPALATGSVAAPIEEAAASVPSTCAEAEPFALRVLDDSMQPEFRRGCIILIDPTGLATDGSYVLARTDTRDHSNDDIDAKEPISGYTFRQLQKTSGDRWMLQALNDAYPAQSTADDLHQVVGVIVQRSGTRRSYHKHY